ncbi:MAG: hypothetical protein DHS20C02_17790 [Micavibrio sp.]|nr:MAG: hypothetical protein DHS20C02_17790 [Micavibrio sp.]
MKTMFKTIILTSLIGAGGALAAQVETPPQPVLTSVETTQPELFNPFNGTSIAGNYLSARFAQQHHDWGHASTYMEDVLEIDPGDADLIKRAMVLSMGSGDTEKAVRMAKKVLKVEPDSSLALLFLTTDAFTKKDYKGAAEHIGKIPESGLSDFVIPLMKSWADAAQGNQNTAHLQDNSIHIYHAILIADYLNQHGQIEELLERSLVVDKLSPDDVERIADIYAHIGKKDTALDLYGKILVSVPENKDIITKMEDLAAGKDMNLFRTIKTPEQGVAEALFDTGQTLFQEYSDDSARVFAHMALYIDPSMTKAKLLLAHISARHERYAQAIEYYKSITPDNKHYMDARRRAATLLEESERIDEALMELQKLVDDHDDLESLIQIGDIHRHNENFKKALEYYNKSAKTFGKKIPADYWHLHYVRGMSYERLGKWKEAEKDLKAALSYQPEHPFILNYLGYAWADQGTNLDESLKMIRKAADLRPTDGYITDSLGWVLYRKGDYEEAVPHLEKAVELLPYDPVVNDHLGDSYWRVGRKLEAKFQWERAKNYAEESDAELVQTIDTKLATGLTSPPVVRAANTVQGEEDALRP